MQTQLSFACKASLLSISLTPLSRTLIKLIFKNCFLRNPRTLDFRQVRILKPYLILLIFSVLPFIILVGQPVIANFTQLSSNLFTQNEQVYLSNVLSTDEYDDVKVMSTSSLSSLAGITELNLSLPNVLSAIEATKLSFNIVASPYYDEIWMGKTTEEENVMLIRKDNLLGGFIQSQEGFFSIIPVRDNVSFLFKHNIQDTRANVTELCGHERVTVETSSATEQDACNESMDSCPAIIDVLVLVSPAATAFLGTFPGADTNPFIPILYTLIGLETSNFALVNSNVQNKQFRFTIEGLDFDFTAGTDIVSDVDNLSETQEVHDLRDLNGSDLVVLLTNQGYAPIFGIVDEIGPDNDNAYAIVEIPFLLNPRWTFAHEVAHLFGARHNRPDNGGNDDADVCSHGWFYTGGALGAKRTIMAASGTPVVPAGTPILGFVPGGRLLNFSNPDIVIDGGATGTVDDDNARTIANTACEVAQFRPPPHFRIQLALSEEEVCMEDLFSATVLIFEPTAIYPGQPPYNISWNVSPNTSSTVLIPVDVSYPQQMLVEVTVTSSDGVVLTKNKTVDIVNCKDGLRIDSQNGEFGLDSSKSRMPNVKSGTYTNPTDITVFPNPTLDEVTILYPVDSEDIVIEILDVNGRKLSVDYHLKDQGQVFSMREFPTGLYFVRILEGSEVSVYSFTKI